MKEDGMCTVQLLFNPKSFTQTIEILFHFLFLIKKGNADIKALEDDDGKSRPMVMVAQIQDAADPRRKSIFSLNML